MLLLHELLMEYSHLGISQMRIFIVEEGGVLPYTYYHGNYFLLTLGP